MVEQLMSEYRSAVPFPDLDLYCDKISEAVRKNGITEAAHYFRVNLACSPKNLKNLLTKRGNLTRADGTKLYWAMLSAEMSLFHMNGHLGEYNLKFVSDCGKYEAVYDIRGDLLCASKSPVNMGTFNYCNPHRAVTALCHLRLDVMPYKKWGNIKGVPAKERAGIRVSESVKQYRAVAAAVMCGTAGYDELEQLAKSVV
ncbi:hypothetical protein FACS1894120_1620 [Clostridia bacterium]|nr:hypothetical protein FACS1894120_1620 [Clostridia bacterium]